MPEYCARCDDEILPVSRTRLVKREALCDNCNWELDEEEEFEAFQDGLWTSYNSKYHRDTESEAEG